MKKNSAITIRIPAALKSQLEARAKAQHRSLSAQVVAELERSADDTRSNAGGQGRFLGMYEGTMLPTDEDFQEVRTLLWGKLGQLDRHV